MSAPTIEIDGAAALLDIFAAEKVDPDAVETALDHNEFFLAFYESMGIDRETIRELILEPTTEREHDVLDSLRSGFAEAAADPTAVRGYLHELSAIDPARVATHVSRYLPANASLDVTVHATIDGFNGGFRFQNDVGISVVGQTTDDVQAVLAHELHHAGLFDVLEEEPVGAMLERDGPDADAIELLVTLAGEGLAIHYAQGGLESFSEATVMATIQEYRVRERELFATVEDGFRTLLTGNGGDERETAVQELLIDEEGSLAPVHYIGARMVDVADRIHDTEAIVESATDPGEFLRLYQTAARQCDDYRFDSEVVDLVTTALP